MSLLTDLILKAKIQNPQLGADLEREFRALSSRLSFGLNFERHRPEAVELPQRPVRRGDKVRILPPRGSTAKGDQQLWVVEALHKTKKTADITPMDAPAPETRTVAIEDLVVVAEFRDTIFPGLVSTGKVSRGGVKPWHTVINAENYHALKALTWTHRGKIDAIYIDPPYNSGARDWKYNNDYVEGDDLYRHSKWLAMMERRLLVAKELLNPDDSVLIVTIDEKEYLRLGMLLDQIFVNARIQMVSSVINHSGVARVKQFYRAEEYIFFVFIGTAAVVPTGEDMLNPPESFEGKKIDLWRRLLRSGTNARRQDGVKQFYPFWIDPEKECIHSVGEYIPLGVSRDSVKPPAPHLVACWPIRLDDSEGNWQISAASSRKGLEEGTVRIGTFTASRGRWSISYLRNAEKKRIARGEIEVVGRDKNGALILRQSATVTRVKNPVSVWNQRSHNAGAGGSNIIRSMLPGRQFPFPKSLYAVEDALRFFVGNKRSGVVLDFFAGSGTTAHAVMRLNKQDGGARQCISITNNEVSADEQKILRERGLRPGDPEWEALGICDHITKPRVQAAITGKTPDGGLIKGDYKFTDEFPMADGFEENAEFFTLTYETPVGVSYQTAFSRIAPLLWLRAGSVGRRIDKLPAAGWDVADSYGLLVDLDTATDFLRAARKAKLLRVAFIVTDDERRFQALSRRLPQGVESVRLYESYLNNFAFANGDSA
ncbi:MAG TPA: site-specific DNA-methyltransferase [Phycisphaerales bacterium]|nr:site-specific DNA-methyltransferase [Phycisphaerales bacterium]